MQLQTPKLPGERLRTPQGTAKPTEVSQLPAQHPAEVAPLPSHPTGLAPSVPPLHTTPLPAGRLDLQLGKT